MDYIPIFWDIETTGLNPMAQNWWDDAKQAQVTAVGLGTIKNWDEAPTRESAEIQVSVIYNEDEYSLLSNLGERLRGMEYDKEPFLVGYNSRKFDHVYLPARCGRLRLNPEPFASEWKRLDMMRVAGKDDRIAKRYPKEGEYADALGVDVPDQYDGSDMPEAFENGEWDKIVSHVEADVEESILMFLEAQDLMMDEFYDHYDIQSDGAIVETIEIPDNEG